MTAPPILAAPSAHPQYACRRPTRAIELCVAGAVHAAVVTVAALAFAWQGSGVEIRNSRPAPLIFRLHQPEAPRARRKAGAMSTGRPSTHKPPPIQRSPAAVSAPLADDPADEPVQAEPGGRDDALAQEAQSYRRAIMARLEAGRIYPANALRKSWQGAGTVLFRIERSGRLLTVMVVTSTGHGSLDAGAVEIVQRAAPFPAIPDRLPDELAITMPVDFLIDHGAMVP